MSRLLSVQHIFLRSTSFLAFDSSSCPDICAFTQFFALMPKFLCVHQIFLFRSTNFLAFDRLSCVHIQILVHSCPDFSAFYRLLCVRVQIFVRSTQIQVRTFLSSPDVRVLIPFSFMPRLLCVLQTFVLSTDLCAFHSRSYSDFRAFTRFSRVYPIFVRSSALLLFNQISCIQQTFVRPCPDFSAFTTRLLCVLQTFVRACSDFCAFTRLSCVESNSGPDFPTFTRCSCVHPMFVHAQTIVRSPDFCTLDSNLCPDFRAFSRFLSVQSILVNVQVFVRSTDFRAFTRLSRIQQIFVS